TAKSSAPSVCEPTTAPLEFTTIPDLGYGTPELTVPTATGTPRTSEMCFFSDSSIIGVANTPLFEAVARDPIWGSPPMVPGFAGTFRAFSIAATVRGFSRGSTTAPWSLHRMMFPRAVRFSSIIVTRAPVERSLEISSSVAMYGSKMELELPLRYIPTSLESAMPIPYASIPSASLKLASFPEEVPAGRIVIFSLAKENIPTLGSPKMSDSITGTALSLARKDYDSPLLVLHNSDSNLPGRLAYSSLPEHAVRLLAQRNFCCLHPLSYEFAQESDGSRSPFLPRSVPYSSEIEIIEFFLNDLQLLFLW